MKDRINKTSICSVVFIDIIDYSKKPVSEQISEKECFNALLTEAIQDIAQNDRIIIDTGDGAAIALLGAPEEALFVSLTIRDGIIRKNYERGMHLLVRIGINLGPVRVVIDINGMPNIIGDGINVAQRVMSFAEPNQILVSRSYYEITSRLTKEITDMFAYCGVKQDKHVREHEVYFIKPSVDGMGAAMPVSAVNEPVVAAETEKFSKQRYIFATAMIFLVGAVIAGVLLPSLVFAPEKTTSQSLETTVSHASSVTEPMSGNNAQAEVAESRPVAQIPASKPRTDKVASGEAKQAITAKPAVVKSGKKNGNPVVANKSPEPDHQSATASPAPAVEPAEKSGWDAFTQSIKHGSETKTCSDAERALNQCR